MRPDYEPQFARLVRFLQGVALAYAVVAVLAGVLALFSGAAGTLGRVLLAGYESNAPQQAEHAFVLSLSFTWLNVGACLWLAVLLLSRERMAWAGLGLLLLVNGAGVLAWGYWAGAVLFALLGYALWRWRGAWRFLHANPVTVKELRGRMRGGRAFVVITLYLGLMSAFTVLVYLSQMSELTGNTIVETGRLGRNLFGAIVGAEMLLVVLIMPALTAGAISGERERHTYDLLRLTLLPLPTLLVGKLASAVAYVGLLALVALPLQSVAFLFGGISQSEVLLVFVGLVMASVLVGAMGICFSAFAPRTMTATLRVYSTVIGALIGLPILSNILFNNAYSNALIGVGGIRDNALLETWLLYADMVLSNLNPIVALLNTQVALVNAQGFVLVDVSLASNSQTVTVLSAWVVLVLCYAILAALLLALGIRRTRQADAG